MDCLDAVIACPQYGHGLREAQEMGIKIGINGFGRIGRNLLRAAIDDGDA